MSRRGSLVALVMLGLMFNGCAFTVDKIPLNYNVPKEATITAKGMDKTIVLQDIEDTRGLLNPRYILQKRNGYGELTSGAYEAEKDISRIITDVVKEVLTSNKYSLVEANGDYLIKGKLISITEDYVMGFWAGNLKLKMEIELSLVNVTQQETVWKEMFIANGMSKKTNSTTTAIQTAFKDAVDNFIKQFVISDFINKIK